LYKYAIKHLNKAERFIRAGEYDYDGKFYDAAIGHAYYAMYHAARALLLLLERSPKTHSGVINSLWENKNKLKNAIMALISSLRAKTSRKRLSSFLNRLWRNRRR